VNFVKFIFIIIVMITSPRCTNIYLRFLKKVCSIFLLDVAQVNINFSIVEIQDHKYLHSYNLEIMIESMLGFDKNKLEKEKIYVEFLNMYIYSLLTKCIFNFLCFY
jgi:hypothetical protein